MPIGVVVTRINQSLVAREIELFLTGKVFSVVTTYKTAPSQSFEPTVLPNFRIAGGFETTDGRMTMPFVPRRRLFWDVDTEKVMVTIGDDVVNLSRIRIDNSLALYRTIVVNGPVSV